MKLYIIVLFEVSTCGSCL